MSKWAHLENIAWAAVFAALMVWLEGGAKLWAVLPVLFVNFPIQRKGRE